MQYVNIPPQSRSNCTANCKLCCMSDSRIYSRNTRARATSTYDSRLPDWLTRRFMCSTEAATIFEPPFSRTLNPAKPVCYTRARVRIYVSKLKTSKRRQRCPRNMHTRCTALYALDEWQYVHICAHMCNRRCRGWCRYATSIIWLFSQRRFRLFLDNEHRVSGAQHTQREVPFISV